MIQVGKEEIVESLFADTLILYVTDPNNDSTKTKTNKPNNNKTTNKQNFKRQQLWPGCKDISTTLGS